MRTRELSPKRFAILSAIINGPRMPSDILEIVNWSTSMSDFIQAQKLLLAAGFITKTPIRGRRGTPISLEVTAAGRQYWTESADFYLHLIALANSEVTLPPAKQLRQPTPKEYSAIREVATGNERRTLDVLRVWPRSLGDLFALDVADIDLLESRVAIRDATGSTRVVDIDTLLKDALAASIGSRPSTQPAILTATGIRWRYQNLMLSWKTLRNRAGVRKSGIPRPSSCHADQEPAPAPVHKERRLPTPTEFRAIRKVAQLHEQVAFAVVRASMLPLETLLGLDVSDVELQHSQITIRKPGCRPRSATIDAPLRHALREAIGSRKSGPAVMRPDGSRWLAGTFGKVWRRACNSAGVPSNVFCRWRPTSIGKLPKSATETADSSTSETMWAG